MYLIDETDEITPELVCDYVKMYAENECTRYARLRDYYEGRHDILKRRRKADQACNNMVCNYAKYITDFASGYLIGEPISYKSETAIDPLLEVFTKAQTDVQDMDNAKYQSMLGKAVELIYIAKDEPFPRVATIDPSQGFLVYNNTVELKPRLGVYFYEKRDIRTQNLKGYHIRAMTEDSIMQFDTNERFALSSEVTEEQHYFGGVPLIETWNNPEMMSDFEPVMTLIDGYNMQMSSRVDDVEEFINSLMVLKGQTLGDTSDEKAETYEDIKKTGVVELTEESDLTFLTRQIDQTGNEVLRKSIADDIHKFSFVPSMTDQNFASNASGVAMEFKMLGLAQMTKIKERYIKEGIRERIKLFSNFMAVKGSAKIDPNQVEINITHSQPKNMLELAQVIANLDGICSHETLLAQLPFVSNPKDEAEKAAEEKQQSLDEQFVMSGVKYDEQQAVLDKQSE